MTADRDSFPGARKERHEEPRGPRLSSQVKVTHPIEDSATDKPHTENLGETLGGVMFTKQRPLIQKQEKGSEFKVAADKGTSK